MSGTVTVVATTEGSNVPPRVRLDVTDIGGTNSTVTVVRLNPDGRTVPVRTPDGNPLILTTSGLNKVGLIYDYEMPYGSAVQYSTLEDPASSSGEVTVDSDRPLLVHPGVPELSQRIVIAAVSPRVQKMNRSVLYPMGRATPIVQTDGIRKAAEYTLTLYTGTDDERLDLQSLLSDGSPLLLNIPAANPWGLPTEYLSVGDVTENRVVEFLGEPARKWEMPVTVIARPSGGSQSQRVYVDLLEYPTYAALMAAYPTYLDVLAGP